MDITHSYSKLLPVLVILILTNILFLQCGEAKEIPSPVTQGFIQSSDGVELSYQMRGSGADTLVMLHGGPGMNFDYLAPDLEPLEETFTLIYYDQRGNGRSTLVSESDFITVDAHVGDLEAIRNYFVTLTNEGISEITRFFSDAVDQGSVPAIEAIVINRNGLLYHEVFGKRDVSRNINLGKGDLFDVASMTKQVTAAGVMILYEEGKLGLDDPASGFLPALGELEILTSFNETDSSYTSAPLENPITVRHLLSHTSGMAYPWWDPRLRMIVARTEDSRFYHYDYLQLPLLFHPGDGWSYGISSRVLGDLIEAITGEQLDDFLNSRIFQPLGMHNTMFAIPDDLEYRRAKVYRRGDNEWTENAPWSNHQPYVLGDATLISTGADFGRFLQMFLNGHFSCLF